MKKRKIFTAVLALLILLQLFASCNVSDQAPSSDKNNSENGNTSASGTNNSESNPAPSDDAEKDATLTGVTFYGYANDWVGEAFLNENRVYHAYYRDESEEALQTDAPRTRSFIITTEEEYRNLGLASPIDVDFEKEMVILYITPSVNQPSNAQKSTLEKATLCEGVLTVQINEEPSADAWSADSGKPYALCLALKAEKANVTEVAFEGISMLYYTDVPSSFGGKAVRFCKYIYNLDDSADYIYVEFQGGGSFIFFRETREIMEFNYMGAVPYFASDARNYYGGPFSYLSKNDSVFVNMLTGKEVDISPEDAKEFSERTRNNFLSKTEYRTNLSATKGNIASEVNEYFSSIKTQK